MYIRNGCKYGFFVTRDTWKTGRYAKVTWIEFVTEGKPPKGNPPYFGGFKNPPGHPREGKIMGPRLVKLEAEWLSGDEWITESGGNYSWTQVYPDE